MKKHPHEQDVIEFAGKVLTEEYFKTLADFIKREYPGSCEAILPKLREIYATKFKKQRSGA